VTWLEGPWEVIVIGPAATFSEAHAVTISQGLVSGRYGARRRNEMTLVAALQRVETHAENVMRRTITLFVASNPT
jgi:hypothetical protein